jgi:hypothetical protein
MWLTFLGPVRQRQGALAKVSSFFRGFVVTQPRTARSVACKSEGNVMTRTKLALVLASLSFAALTAPPVLAVPTVWEPAAGGNGHLYQVVRVGTPHTWVDARTAAQALGPGWDLATITSAEENAFVKSLFEADSTFARAFTRCGEPDICWYWIGPWIGGYNFTAPDTFQWVTGEPVSFTDLMHGMLLGWGQQIAYVARYDFSPPPDFHWAAPPYLPIAYVAEYPQPPAVLSLALTQATVAGCRSVTGTVTLPHPAPPAGVVVTLSETLRSASSPMTLSIAPGATSGTFTIMTRPLTERETGTVRAALGSTTRSKQLTVRPMGLASLAFATPTVVGGKKTVGTATLECKAAPGPITVELESSKPAVAYPVAASISVPQGIKSATFDVATNAVLSKTTATITGTANGITKSKVVTMIPAAAVSPSSLRFGSVSVGSTSATQSATLTNKGASAFSVSSIGITGTYASWFALTNNCGATLNAGASCMIRVTFKPLGAASRSAMLRIATSATSTPRSVSLSGTGI